MIKKIACTIISVFVLLLSCSLTPAVLAAGYGDGNFGGGSFNEGESVSNNNNQQSQSSASNGVVTCNDNKPGSAPLLFQIKTNNQTATLYFVPAKSPLTYYWIAYGTDINRLAYGAQFNGQPSNGVGSFNIGYLKPNTKYFFKIRAGNGCTPGDWSELLTTKTSSSKSVSQNFYPTKVSLIQKNVSFKKTDTAKVAISAQSALFEPTITLPIVVTATPTNVAKIDSKPLAKPQTSWWMKIVNLFR